MSTAAAIVAFAAVYMAALSVAYARSTARFGRAIELYRAGRVAEGDAESRRARKLMRRADMLSGTGLLCAGKREET